LSEIVVNNRREIYTHEYFGMTKYLLVKMYIQTLVLIVSFCLIVWYFYMFCLQNFDSKYSI